MTRWLTTGLHSLRRLAHRRRYIRAYQSMTPHARYVMRKAEADPRSLIARGLL